MLGWMVGWMDVFFSKEADKGVGSGRVRDRIMRGGGGGGGEGGSKRRRSRAEREGWTASWSKGARTCLVKLREERPTFLGGCWCMRVLKSRQSE